jgi:ABC-type transport system involved in multi-copper enzyme maturation permease subunit
MTTLAHPLAARSLELSDLLKLRRRRGLVLVVGLLTVVAVIAINLIMELLHIKNAQHYAPAGGINHLGHLAFVIAALAGVAATVVGATVGTGDLESGVYRELVLTGRSRRRLLVSRLVGGLGFLFPFVVVAYGLEAVAAVVFAGSNAAPTSQLLVTTGLWTVLEVLVYYLLAVGVGCLVGVLSYTIGILLAFRLAVTPILAGISVLGIAREALPGVAVQALSPSTLGDTVRMGPHIPMSTAAIAAVLLVWVGLALLAGGWRDTTRDA